MKKKLNCVPGPKFYYMCVCACVWILHIVSYKFRINLFTEMLLNLKTEKNDAALVELKGRWSQYKNLIHCLPKD